MIELRAGSYTVGSTGFTINAIQSCPCKSITTLRNGEQFKLITCLSFPAVTNLVPVFITLNGVSYPVLDEFGNTLMSDQIRCRRCYRLVFGTNANHFMVKQCLCSSQATPTQINTNPSSASQRGGSL